MDVQIPLLLVHWKQALVFFHHLVQIYLHQPWSSSIMLCNNNVIAQHHHSNNNNNASINFNQPLNHPPEINKSTSLSTGNQYNQHNKH